MLKTISYISENTNGFHITIMYEDYTGTPLIQPIVTYQLNIIYK